MDPTIVILPALFGLIAFMLWMTLSGWQQRHRTNAIRDLGMQLLAKVGSPADLGPFLESAAGVDLVKRLVSEPLSAKHRVLHAVQVGVVLLSAAAGLYVVGRFGSVESREAGEVLRVLGVVAGSVGIGFLLSAVAGQWVASRLRTLD